MSNPKTPNDEGMRAAERFAGWEIGDRKWAQLIIDAYLNPAEANAKMDAEGIPERTGTWR